ncbi:hypothetical protein BWI17_03955 [Betaproteobacteria bacterium GR16-43]|nr:hypothetical protein BWI17_03955 [Betaproteobacteria bacterium GR16-43]
MKRIAAVLAALAAAPAAADFRINDAGLQFFVPQAPWALRLPRDDWQVLQEKRSAGGGVYYFIASPSRELQFSIFLDKTDQCDSASACRDLWKRNTAKVNEAARDLSERDRNGFSVVQFHLDKPGGHAVVQTNVSAHAYRDGYWIDVRVTKVGETRPDPEPLLAVLDAMAFRAKSLEGARQYPAGSGKYLALDLPPDWRDALGKGIGTVEVMPATGENWKMLMTVLPPRDRDAPPPTREQLLDATKAVIIRIREQSTGDLQPREFKGRSATGFRFSATDKNPAPGEYRFMSQGVMAVGNVSVTFTVLSNAGEEKSVARMLDILAGMRFAQ